MNRIEIFNIIRPIVANLTGVSTVILADQTRSDGSGIPSPSGEYITIEPKQRIDQRGQANVHRKNSATPQSLDVDVRAQIIVEAIINVFRGSDAVSRLERLTQANKRPDVFEILYKAGLGWQRTTGPNNLTALQSGNPEQRAQMYLYLMYETTDPIVINTIESVEYEVQNENGDILISGDV